MRELTLTLISILFCLSITGCKYPVNRMPPIIDTGPSYWEKQQNRRKYDAPQNAKHQIEMAGNAEEFSYSLALIHYKTMLQFYFDAGDYKKVSFENITYDDLTSKIIPEIREKAFNEAKNDLFECVLYLYAGSSSIYHTPVYPPDLISIANLLEQSGQTERAAKIKAHLSKWQISGSSQLNEINELATKAESLYADGNKKEGLLCMDKAFELISGGRQPFYARDALRSAAVLYANSDDYDKTHKAFTLLFEIRQWAYDKECADSLFSDIETDTGFRASLDAVSEVRDLDPAYYTYGIPQNEDRKFISLGYIVDGLKQKSKMTNWEHHMQRAEELAFNLKHRDKALIGLKLAACYYRAGRTEKADQVLEKSLVYPSNAQPWTPIYCVMIEATECLVDMGRKDKAIEILNSKQLRNNIKSNIKHNMEVVMCNVIAGNNQKAESMLGEIMKNPVEGENIKSKLFPELIRLANFYYRAGNKQRAESLMEEAYNMITGLDPGNQDIAGEMRYKIECLREMAHFKSAVKIAGHLDENYKASQPFVISIIDGLIDRGELREALNLANGIKKDPERAKELEKVAGAYINSGNVEKAVAIANSITDENMLEGKNGIISRAVIAYAGQGKFEKVREILCPENEVIEYPVFLAKAIVKYISNRNLSTEEQRSLADEIMECTVYSDYVKSLSGVKNVKLAVRAEKDLVACASYLASPLDYPGSITEPGAYQIERDLRVKPQMQIGLAQGFLNLSLNDRAKSSADTAYDLIINYKPDFVDLRRRHENLLDIAELHIRLGDNKRAIEIVDLVVELDKEKVDYETVWGYVSILEIPLTYQKAGARDKAEEFFNKLPAMTYYFHRRQPDSCITALNVHWLIEQDELDAAYQMIMEDMQPDERSWFLLNLAGKAFSKGKTEMSLECISKLEYSERRANSISNLFLSPVYYQTNFVNLKEFQHSNIEQFLNGLLDWSGNLSDPNEIVNMFGIVAEGYHENGNRKKAEEILQDALNIAKNQKDKQRVVPAVWSVALTMAKLGFIDKADEIKPAGPPVYSSDYIKNFDQKFTENKAIGYAVNGDYKSAMKTIPKIEDLNDPFNTLNAIASALMDNTQYDNAFEVIEKANDREWMDIVDRRRIGCGPGISPPRHHFSPYPVKFAKAGRFDLALKTLIFIDETALPWTLLNIESIRKESDYQLTVEDNESLKKLIHMDVFFH